MQVLIANPPRSRRRKSRKSARRRKSRTSVRRTSIPRKRRRRRAAAVVTAKPRRRRRRRSSFPFSSGVRTVARKVRRRRSGRRSGGFSRAAGGFVYLNKGIIKDGLIAAGTVVGIDTVLAKLPLPAQASNGYGRVVATAVIGGVLAALASKFAGRQTGAAIATGAVVKSGIDAFLTYQGKAPTNFSLAGYYDQYPSGGVSGYYDNGAGVSDAQVGTFN